MMHTFHRNSGRRRYLVSFALAVTAVSVGLVAVFLTQNTRAARLADDNESVAQLEQAFHAASQAYKSDNMAEAIEIYTGIIEQGYESSELYYNTGNAYFRNGEMGKAILYYRRAWLLSPRDPDIAANLEFAINTSGALVPHHTLAVTLLYKLPLPQWIGLAVGAYWMMAVLLILYLVTSRRVIFLRLLIPTGAVLLVSLAGIACWYQLYHTPEAVVISRTQEALFAPLADSTAHFSIPEGSIIRIQESSKQWVKISCDGKSGWIPKTSCLEIIPSQAE